LNTSVCPVGVENPLKHEFRENFKREIIDQLNQQHVNIQNCRLWPDVGFRGVKLIEPDPIILNKDTSQKAIQQFSNLSKFNNVVGEVIRKYYNMNCFSSLLSF